MENDKQQKYPARYRQTLWARVHYLLWSTAILALWPLSLLLRTLEKIRKYV